MFSMNVLRCQISVSTVNTAYNYTVFACPNKVLHPPSHSPGMAADETKDIRWYMRCAKNIDSY